MTCTCTPCPECDGTGNVWFSFSGQYLRKARWDDMDELETCPECNGERIIEVCDVGRTIAGTELSKSVADGLIVFFIIFAVMDIIDFARKK